MRAQFNAALKLALKNPDSLKNENALGAVAVTTHLVEPAAHKAFVSSENKKLNFVWMPQGNTQTDLVSFLCLLLCHSGYPTHNTPALDGTNAG